MRVRTSAGTPPKPIIVSADKIGRHAASAMLCVRPQFAAISALRVRMPRGGLSAIGRPGRHGRRRLPQVQGSARNREALMRLRPFAK